MSQREFVHVGTHAEILSSGRGVGPGDRVPESELHLTSKDEVGQDQHLLDEEHLVDIASFGGASNKAKVEKSTKQATAPTAQEGATK